MSTPAFPSLMSLRSFMLVAELASYSRAAEQLGVTHAAVIHQVRALERQVGSRLLQRVGNGVRCSPSGAELLVKLRPSLRVIEELFALEPRAHDTERITIGLVPAFANGWLLPRLPRLAARFPWVEFHLRPELAVVDLRADGVDVALRHGSGQWEGLLARPLLDEALFPIGSPSSPAAVRLRSVADLASAVLVENPLQPWRAWFEANGLAAARLRFGLVVPDSYSAQLAAEGGIGGALGRESLTEAALAARRLVRLDLGAQPLHMPWYVAILRTRARERLLQAVVDSLIEFAAVEGREAVRLR